MFKKFSSGFFYIYRSAFMQEQLTHFSVVMIMQARKWSLGLFCISFKFPNAYR